MDEAKLRGRYIANLRERRLWTRDKLAKEAGVWPNTITNAEEGRGQLRFGTIRKLAEALEVDPLTILHPPQEEEAPKAAAPPSPAEERRDGQEALRVEQLRYAARLFDALTERRRAALKQAGPDDIPALVHESIYVVNGAIAAKRNLDLETQGSTQAVQEAVQEVERSLAALEDALYAISDEAQRRNAAITAGVSDEIAAMRRRKASA